jgi:hypothetical protein
MSRHEMIKMFKLVMQILFHIAYQVEPVKGFYLKEIEKKYDKLIHELDFKPKNGG